MKNSPVSLSKWIAIAMVLLFATPSFSQHSHNYYPSDHDTGGQYRPTLIKKNFIYYGFLSTLNQHISIEFNHQMSDQIMLCAQIGLINSGLSQESNSNNSALSSSIEGAYFEGGVKLFFNPDYTRSGNKGYYVIEGLYIKPEFVVSIFNTISTTYQSSYVYPPPLVTNDYSYTGAAITVSMGGQWIIAHSVAIDLYGGVGVSFSSAYSQNLPAIFNYYGYLTAGTNFPLAFIGGINIGLPFK